MTNALSIGTSAIRTIDNFYSLNDLHKASGGDENHQPSFFLRNEQAKALIDEITKSANSQTLITKTIQGRTGGTYVCKELVYAYGMWISAAFNLKVIRAFDASHKPDSQAIRRFIVHYQDGRAILQPIQDSEFLTRHEDLPALIKSTASTLSDESLASIAQSCIERMAAKNKTLRLMLSQAKSKKG